MPWTAALAAGKDYRLSGPHTHGNLAIYLIHRDGLNGGPVPLTLAEALEQGRIKVLETGDVGRWPCATLAAGMYSSRRATS